MLANEPSGYSLVSTTVKADTALATRVLQSFTANRLTERPRGLDGVNLSIQTPAGTAEVNHGLECQGIILEVDNMRCSSRFLPADIGTL